MSRAAVFKVAPGDRTRDYWSTFEDHDVALVGPGWLRSGPADWRQRENNPWREWDRRSGDWKRVNALAEMPEGSICICVRGTKDVQAVGLVVGDYDLETGWLQVDGWDLFHQRRVRWARPTTPPPEGARAPTAGACRLGPQSAVLREWAREEVAVLENRGEFDRDLKPLPDFAALREPGDERLLSQSLRDELYEAQRYLGRHLELRSEASVVALVLVPLLLESGFSRDQIEVERDGVDVLCHRDESGDQPCLLVEAKAPRHGLSMAKDQAFGYASRFPGAAVCLTTGASWKLFARNLNAPPHTAWLPMVPDASGPPYLSRGIVDLFARILKLATGP